MEIAINLIAIGIFSLAVAIFLLRIHIAKTKLEKKKPVDKEKEQQELSHLRTKVEWLECNRIQGYITEEEFQSEMAKIDERLKVMERGLYG